MRLMGCKKEPLLPLSGSVSAKMIALLPRSGTTHGQSEMFQVRLSQRIRRGKVPQVRHGTAEHIV